MDRKNKNEADIFTSFYLKGCIVVLILVLILFLVLAPFIITHTGNSRKQIVQTEKQMITSIPQINISPFIDIDKIAQIESSNNPQAINKNSGARGLCQFMKPTWEESVTEIGCDWSWEKDVFDGEKNKIVANYYMNIKIPKMLKYYNIPDNTETRLTAYNWGIGNLNKCYQKYQDKWITHIPQETYNYIQKYNRL